jgi:hypothetical protein
MVEPPALSLVNCCRSLLAPHVSNVNGSHEKWLAEVVMVKQRLPDVSDVNLLVLLL